MENQLKIVLGAQNNKHMKTVISRTYYVIKNKHDEYALNSKDWKKREECLDLNAAGVWYSLDKEKLNIFKDYYFPNDSEIKVVKVVTEMQEYLDLFNN